ncbi:hypothetical protein Gotur_003164 [Gossypium turneri]
MAEAHAGLQAVKLGISMGFNSVDIIGDSRIIIKKCNSTTSDKSVIGEIIREFKVAVAEASDACEAVAGVRRREGAGLGARLSVASLGYALFGLVKFG